MLISNTIHSGNKSELDIPPVGSNAFIFKIDKDCITSAGVYDNTKKLVKTLWSGRSLTSGSHAEQWDGTDDEGNKAPGGNYTIIILSNNVEYEWEGVIGNTSQQLTGEYVYRNSNVICNMAVSGEYAYFVSGYNEQKASQQKFSISTPQKRLAAVPVNKRGQHSTFVTTDGKIVYWGGVDVDSNWFVFATDVHDDTEITTFSYAASAITRSKQQYTGMDYVSGKNAATSGLAVQKNGKHLFISHHDLNSVHILDKNTGQLLKTWSIAQPGLITTDSANGVWIVSQNNRLEKYTINEGSTLSPAGISVRGLFSVAGLSLSFDGSYILVADAGVSQQAKAFSSLNGNPLWIFGQEKGYSISSKVEDDKFYFSDLRRENAGAFICCMPDGSFWVGDAGNYRVQHYTNNRHFMERIMYIPSFYSCVADANRPDRIFADYLEFQVDYTKPLSGNNQSWALQNNWGATVPLEYDNHYMRLRGATTLRNGKTYAMLLHNKRPSEWQLVELQKAGTLRFTDIRLPLLSLLYPDGSLRSTSAPVIGQPTTWTIKELQSFTADNNPIWKQEQIIATSPPNTAEEPLYKGNINTLHPGEITDSGVLISFDASHPPKGNDGWHLGGIKKGENTWQWRTARSTSVKYEGPFPPDGAFDIGNSVRYTSSVAIAFGNYVVWNYYGEFWKASETNKWNLVYHNGLFMGQFGITGPEMITSSPAMAAGNALSAAVVNVPGAGIFLYHNDESQHGGIHRWRIKNLDSVREQAIPVSLSYITQGLLATYFREDSLNNLSIQSTVFDGDLQHASLPLGSIRWQGFLKPESSGQYTLYVSTNGQLRLWLHDQLLIDKWNNTQQNEFLVTCNVNTDSLTPLKIELANARNISVEWNSTNQSKSVISKKHFVPAINSREINRFNLLEGLPAGQNSVVQDNLYGWHRYPLADDYTNIYQQWWTVLTNIKTYLQNNAGDIRIRFRLASTKAYVERDISLPHPVTSWQLSGVINYELNQPNKQQADTMYFDILDTNGAIIVRQHFESQYPQASLLINGITVAFDSYTQKLSAFNTSLPFLVSADASGVRLSLGSFKEYKGGFFEKNAQGLQPGKLRISFFSDKNSAGKAIDLADLWLAIKE